MHRLLTVVGALAACGDNLAGPKDASVQEAGVVGCVPIHGGTVTLRQIALGCDQPNAPASPACMNGPLTLSTSPPDDPRLFVVELGGAIRIIENDELRGDPFLDVSSIIVVDGELGLLGLAFSPHYATDHTFYIDYTAANPDQMDTDHPYVDVVARYTVDPTDAYHADPTTGAIVLSIPDPFSNHNGGMIEFGNDGDLYISTGDGGGVVPDIYGNAQNPHALLGKMLRIDVVHPANGKPYAIPSDNPFASGVAGAPEVWVLGLRNPWRWSFDSATGDMWIGDVGAATIEEIDVLRAGEQAGKNLGWPMFEGSSCFQPPCDPAGMTFPQDERLHSAGWWAITGGQVYRGSCMPDWDGVYFYSDTGFGHMSIARLQSDGSLQVDTLPGDFVGYSTSIHADAHGELYETLFLGDVFKIIVQP